MARRAASISRAVIRARLVAFRPNSPKDTLAPRCAKPPLRPLNCLRYLVRLGCSISLRLHDQAWAGGSLAGAAAGPAGGGTTGVPAGAAAAAGAASSAADSAASSLLSNTSPLKIHTLTPITP